MNETRIRTNEHLSVDMKLILLDLNRARGRGLSTGGGTDCMVPATGVCYYQRDHVSEAATSN